MPYNTSHLMSTANPNRTHKTLPTAEYHISMTKALCGTTIRHTNIILLASVQQPTSTKHRLQVISGEL